jgi:hypothetical protein
MWYDPNQYDALTIHGGDNPKRCSLRRQGLGLSINTIITVSVIINLQMILSVVSRQVVSQSSYFVYQHNDKDVYILGSNIKVIKVPL